MLCSVSKVLFPCTKHIRVKRRIYFISTQNRRLRLCSGYLMFWKEKRYRQEHLPLVIPHGLLEEGWGWSVELSPGMSLREIWDNEPHNPLRSIRLVMQAVDAVAALHANGGVHGDIGAQNIWVGWNSEEGERSTLLGEQLGLWLASEKWDSVDMSLMWQSVYLPKQQQDRCRHQVRRIWLGRHVVSSFAWSCPVSCRSAWEMAALQATSELNVLK